VKERRSPGMPSLSFNERRWKDLERPLWKSGHCCHQFQMHAVYIMRSIHLSGLFI
jgi:hypothetical protein